MFESKTPPSVVFRIARRPDPWQPPDWSRSQADGTFGNRFDDPYAYYRVLYAATQKLACFLETLARFRIDLSLMVELDAIKGENDFFPLGEVPVEWCERRLLGAASAEGNYADICSTEWTAHLRRKLSGECLRLGLADFDSATLQSDVPRRITQMASFEVYLAGFHGVYYRSRYNHELENWALFEPFRLKVKTSESITPEDPVLLEAFRIFGLRWKGEHRPSLAYS